jgi:hypothetical protein
MEYGQWEILPRSEKNIDEAFGRNEQGRSFNDVGMDITELKITDNCWNYVLKLELERLLRTYL